MACTDNGKPRYLMTLSPSRRARAVQNNMHLAEGLQFTERYGLPILNAYHGRTDLNYIPYSARSENPYKDAALCFFEDDYKFATATWDKLDQTTFKLAREQKYQCLCTPDHSLYVDMPKATNLWNIYKSRFAGAFWQRCGFDVIPTASWGNADSFEYCFEGLPSHSVIAICGIGHNWCAAAHELWIMGIHSLESHLQPSEILVYGGPTMIPDTHTPIKFITPYVKTKFKKNEYRK